MSMNPTRYSRITGTGSYLPPNRLTNAVLAAQLAEDGVETSDAWIVYFNFGYSINDDVSNTYRVRCVR